MLYRRGYLKSYTNQLANLSHLLADLHSLHSRKTVTDFDSSVTSSKQKGHYFWLGLPYLNMATMPEWKAEVLNNGNADRYTQALKESNFLSSYSENTPLRTQADTERTAVKSNSENSPFFQNDVRYLNVSAVGFKGPFAPDGIHAPVCVYVGLAQIVINQLAFL